MKKSVKIITLCVISFMFAILILCLISNSGTNREINATCLEINEKYTTFVDENGECWETLTSICDCIVGNDYIIIINDNSTPSKYDDIIVEVHNVK